jgi:hypothetical protein
MKVKRRVEGVGIWMRRWRMRMGVLVGSTRGRKGVRWRGRREMRRVGEWTLRRWIERRINVVEEGCDHVVVVVVVGSG